MQFPKKQRAYKTSRDDEKVSITKESTPSREPSERTAQEISDEPIASPKTTHIRQVNSAPRSPQRPGLQRRRTTARTRYIDMLLGLDNVSPVHNILASLFVWILLAGYIVFPATFNSLSKSSLDDKADTKLKAQALATARNLPLLYVAAVACGIGVLGCLWLWWKHRENYVWVINRIFLPSLLNSLAGLVSTLVNVYSAQDGQYSVTAKVTVVVTAACSVVAAALFLLYNTVMLRLVRKKHEKEVRMVEKDGRDSNVQFIS